MGKGNQSNWKTPSCQVTQGMIRIYKPKDMCWLGYKLTRSNGLTYHHIIKAEHGGLRTFDNGGLLTNIGHQYVHIIEYRDLEIYVRLNQIFQIINNQKHKPTLEQYKQLNDLLKCFEKDHKKDTNGKGKVLIKQQYYNREIYNL